MLGVFDSGFWGLQTVKYLVSRFPHEDVLFLADSKNVPYGNKSKQELKKLTIQWINYLFQQGCSHVIIACNTAAASIHEHWFEIDKEKRLISVTKCGLKEVIKYHYKNIAVFCTQATHTLGVYEKMYTELWWSEQLYTISTPELVPLIESQPINRNQIKHHIQEYTKYLHPNTDCLILWCTHYPIILDIIWEILPRLKIIDPGRNSIFTISKRLEEKWCNKTHGRGSISIECTWSKKKFYEGSCLIFPEISYNLIKEISI